MCLLEFPRKKVVHDRRRHDVDGLQRGRLDVSGNSQSSLRRKIEPEVDNAVLFVAICSSLR